MESLFILGVAALTSGLACLVGRRRGLTGRGLRRAFGEALECLGLMLVFFAANVAAGIVLTLGLRRLTGGFVSLYTAADLTLLVLSLVQALVFRFWRDGSAVRD